MCNFSVYLHINRKHNIDVYSYGDRLRREHTYYVRALDILHCRRANQNCLEPTILNKKFQENYLGTGCLEKPRLNVK